MTPDEQALLNDFDGPPYVKGAAGAIPFLDFASSSMISGATYDPGLLLGKGNYDQIAGALSDPSSDLAQAIDGSANVITAEICRITNEQPASVCADPMIASVDRRIPPRA